MKKIAKYPSITVMIKQKLAENPEVKYSAVKTIVTKFFPESKFNERHFSWYKSAFKRGILKGVRK